MLAAKSARGTAFGSAFEVSDSIIARALVPDPLFHIVDVSVGMKADA